ncbi:MAG TPA: N-acetylmuramoyl-L-alanine amidase, partial [Burkholderiaceae bacterium]|nr:N-acetylmuramoyl-L-alanine amidase [Burkholderiaceae bacterium]
TALAASTHASPLIVLDPGHNPDHPGATSIQGTKEIRYNDRFVEELAPALEHAGWRVRLTRQPGQSIGLVERAELANRLHATLFLSIHHDSAQLRYLKKIRVGNRTGYQTIKPIAGYSLYVSRENPDFAESLRLAELLGKQLRSLGRPPALHHAEKIPGENHPLLNKYLGIYQYDKLAVLRHTKVPAVLLEVGVITDKQDEAYVANAGNRKKMIGKIVEALQQYVHTEGAAKGATNGAKTQ